MHRYLTSDRLATLVGPFDRDPAYRGLRMALQERIGDGRIPLDTRLPSERDVVRALGVSRNTVARAYADLVAAGFAVRRQGAGTFVVVPPERRRAHDHALHSLTAARATQGSIDLNCAAGPAIPGVMAAYRRALETLPAYLGSDGYLPSGLPALQARIAQTYIRRGLPTSPDQIVVTSGALSALAIVARALTRRGDRVLIESPTYSNAIEALQLGGGRLLSAPMADPVGGQGWDLDGIAASVRQGSPRLAYLVPDFQNPTGLLMDDAARARCAHLFGAAGVQAIVDETLQGTAMDSRTMPLPFAAHLPAAITIGGMSKQAWGGLRVGWVRAPQALVDTIIGARVKTDLGTSLFDQLVAAELLACDDGAQARREQLRGQRDALVHGLREHLPEWQFRVPDGGLTLWVRLPHGSATATAMAAEQAGVHVVPGPVFSVEGGLDDWLRIPFAKPADVLQQAVPRIAEAWRAAAPRAQRTMRSAELLVV